MSPRNLVITTKIFLATLFIHISCNIIVFIINVHALYNVSSKQILAEADTDSVKTGADDRVDSDHGNYFINCVNFLLLPTTQLDMILPT